MPVLRSLRQENCYEFNISIDLRVGPYVRKLKQQERSYGLSAVLFHIPSECTGMLLVASVLVCVTGIGVSGASRWWSFCLFFGTAGIKPRALSK